MVSLHNQSSRAMSFLCLLHLNGHRHRLATAKTQGSQAATTATAAQLVDQCCQDTRTAGTNGVPECDGSAIDVYARPIPVKFFAVCQGLGGKCFVDFDE